MGGATVAAVCLGELSEALGVMIFYQIGEMFQDRAAGKSRSSIRSLLATKPSAAHVLQDRQCQQAFAVFARRRVRVREAGALQRAQRAATRRQHHGPGSQRTQLACEAYGGGAGEDRPDLRPRHPARQ